MPRTTRPAAVDRAWVPLLAGLAILVLIAVLAIVNSGDGDSNADVESGSGAQGSVNGASEETREFGESLAHRKAGDPMALGPKDAPVVLIAYSDYFCPYCRTWVRDTQPKLRDDVDKGNLRIEWREFPYKEEDSTTVAIAARAAARQDRFWEFHEAFYSEKRAPGDGTEATLDSIAEEIGLDTERFDEDRSDSALADEVRADFDEGQSIGVNATPAFLVNGQPVMGAQPLSEFTNAIDAALEDARGES